MCSQKERGQASVGDGGSFFCAVLSHFVSVVKNKGLTARSVPVSAIVARMFAKSQEQVGV